MYRVAVVVPFRAGCAHRERAWRWVRSRYETAGLRVHIAPAPSGPWCKAAAMMPAIEATDAEIVIQADADVWTAGLREALDAVEGGAPWAIPHDLVHRLTEDATAAVIAGADWQEQPREERPRTGVPGGGLLVAPRETLLEIPLDARFVGWGQEDLSQGAALATLAGEPWRGETDLVHLWHPPQARETRKHGSPESWALWRRYAAARHDPDAMRVLIEESRDASPASEHPREDHPALGVG